MRILVVEDTQAKLKRIVAVLMEAGISRDQIEVAVCSYSARQFLRNDYYDLLLLDVLIPFRQEDDPDAQVCVDLLEDISEGGEYKRPGNIVGLTAYDEGIADAVDTFNEMLWNVIKVSEADNGWVERVKNCVNYLRSARKEDVTRTSKAEVLVICALRSPELEAVKKLPWNWEAETPFDDVSFISKGVVSTAKGNVRVIAAAAPRMGMVASAVLASKLIADVVPDICAMPGISAGFSGRVELGDVVFADPVWDYQAGKRIVDGKGEPGFEMAPHQIQSSPELRALIEQLSEDKDILRSIRDAWPNPPRNDLRIRIGPVASGSAVVADRDFAKEVSHQQRAALGLEMELYGVSSACAMATSPRPKFVGLKAVCDFADADKNDGLQSYSAYTSAAVLDHLVRRYFDVC
ncbi:TPA: hypothetical protein QEL08_003351 [Stenotrophomonas maltophilia]|nr:hypothetical protein [Stenotrophomonas maltophilia]HDS1585587.1 hypothetical protein [Stenotrophomonas maltophilia]